jgi:hypothetical protein
VDHGTRWLALTVCIFVSADFARRKNGWAWVLRLVILAGLFQLVVGSLQDAFSGGKVLFFYEPASGQLTGFSTFINNNHASVFFGLVSLAALSLCSHRYTSNRAESSIAGALAVAFMIAMHEHASQGASIAYWVSAAGMLLVLASRVLPQEGLRESIRRRFFGALGVFCASVLGLGVVAWWTWSQRLREWIEATPLGQWFFSRGVVRLELIDAGLTAALDYPFLGAGAGATRDVIPHYIDWNVVPAATIRTIENEPVEWLYTLGIPVGLMVTALLLTFFASAFAHHKSKHRHRLLAVFMIGLYFALNSLFHFPFFTLGLSIPFVCLLTIGLVSGRNRRKDSESLLVRFSFFSVSFRTASVGSVVALVGGGLMFWLATTAFSVTASSPEGQLDELDGFVEIQQLAPARGETYARGALVALEAGLERRAVSLAAFAFEIDPATPNLLTHARVLSKTGATEQSEDLYAEFFESDRGKRRRVRERVIRVLVADFANAEDRASVMRSGTSQDWRYCFQYIRRTENVSSAILFGLALSEERPGTYEPYRLVARGYLLREQPLLAEMFTRSYLDQNQKLEPSKLGAAYAVIFDALVDRGKVDDARALVIAKANLLRADRGFWKSAAALLGSTDESPNSQYLRAIQEGYRKWCSQPSSERGQLECWGIEARLAEVHGDIDEAEWAYLRVYKQTGKPIQLINFYSRYFRCKDLAALRKRWLAEHGDKNETEELFDRKLEACNKSKSLD